MESIRAQGRKKLRANEEDNGIMKEEKENQFLTKQVTIMVERNMLAVTKTYTPVMKGNVIIGLTEDEAGEEAGVRAVIKEVLLQTDPMKT